VARVKKFQRRRRLPDPRLVISLPFHLAVVFKTLEVRRDFVQLVVRVERVFADAQLVALARHHVHRIVQHAFHEQITQLRHQDVRLGKFTARQRQRADMVMMAMRKGDGIHVMGAGLVEQRHRVAPLAFRMHAGVEQNAVFVQLH
jgi:hypothetical protein